MAFYQSASNAILQLKNTEPLSYCWTFRNFRDIIIIIISQNDILRLRFAQNHSPRKIFCFDYYHDKLSTYLWAVSIISVVYLALQSHRTSSPNFISMLSIHSFYLFHFFSFGIHMLTFAKIFAHWVNSKKERPWETFYSHFRGKPIWARDNRANQAIIWNSPQLDVSFIRGAILFQTNGKMNTFELFVGYKNYLFVHFIQMMTRKLSSFFII